MLEIFDSGSRWSLPASESVTVLAVTVQNLSNMNHATCP